ncbi:hypothetical protein SERLA73DRAFT_133192 [Serpula lacrymans var. lacrymans S7.3]|uniref:Uncharacterized protein n=2 Tax=Serpula lacrymans var. lacrymans TaxID=341189 RepID=F8PQL3_SERL3|nr:uncharacterized protein SERLADRAFT_462404 [Serpula lacrymans var. lacrymans S7.9]EGO02261.1 hypothetical protein SERLA73DRAFT_133192 [Serpula lacrymans var. lacrymans S7.3]EGO28006.1 hypothetical protein SERLADRAFT_462404 [Serpula lacrymans var. lacrymans S7.9]
MSIDIFGYIAGGLGIIGLIYSVLHSQLPTTKLKSLDAIIQETQDLFHNATEDGLFVNPRFVTQVEDELFYYRNQTADLRTRALCTNSIFQEYIEMARGLSRTISIVHANVAKLRSSVLTTSEEERKRLYGSGRLRNRMATLAPNHSLGGTTENCHRPISVNDDQRTLVHIPCVAQQQARRSRFRSRSCPPAHGDHASVAFPSVVLNLQDDVQPSLSEIPTPVFYGPLPNHTGFLLTAWNKPA